MNPKLKLLLATLPLLVSLIVVGRGMPNYQAEATNTYSCADIVFGENTNTSFFPSYTLPNYVATSLSVETANISKCYFQEGSAMRINPRGKIKFVFEVNVIRSIIYARLWGENSVQAINYEDINKSSFTLSNTSKTTYLEITKIVLRVN